MKHVRIVNPQRSEDVARLLASLGVCVSHAMQYDQAHITSSISSLARQNRGTLGFNGLSSINQSINESIDHAKADVAATASTAAASSIIDRVLPANIPRPSNQSISQGLTAAAQLISQTNSSVNDLKNVGNSHDPISALSNVAASFVNQTAGVISQTLNQQNKQSLDQFVPPLSQSTAPSFSRSAQPAPSVRSNMSQPIENPSVSFNQSINQSMTKSGSASSFPANQSFDIPMSRAAHQSSSKPIPQPINESFNIPIEEPVRQSVPQSNVSSFSSSQQSFSDSRAPPTVASMVEQTATQFIQQTNETINQFIPRPSKFVPRERSVPSTPIGRLFGFGGIAARMVAGPILDATKRAFGAQDPYAARHPQAPPVNRSSQAQNDHRINDTLSDESTSSSLNSALASDSHISSGESTSATGTQPKPESRGVLSHFMSEANTERLAEGLCRMRGAALKVGQMLSIQDDSLLPPQLRQVLDRVRDGADVMPRNQLERTLAHELGSDWQEQFESFDMSPIAAASIGQVHKAVLPEGRKVAVKVQYPGVAESIHSDVNNVRTLIRLFNVLPAGMYIDQTMQAAKEELSEECDYNRERSSQMRFKALVASNSKLSNFWFVPTCYDSHSTKHVLTSELVEGGVPIDSLTSLSQERRNDICRNLLRLCLTELFEWRFMQTDPNWSNFLYVPTDHRMALIDFGASREYSKPFVDSYLRMVSACAERDREGVIHWSQKMGFLTGDESGQMLDAHVEAAFIVGEPFSKDFADSYNFAATDMAARVSNLAKIMVKLRLTAPPKDSYTLHRKLSGCFLTCKKLEANIPCRELFQELLANYRFEDDPADDTVVTH